MKTKFLILAVLCPFTTLLADTTYPVPTVGFILVFMPVVLFLLPLFALFRMIKKGSVKMENLLTEKDLPDNHPAATPAPLPGAPATPVQDAPQSTSRLVLLLSGIAAVVIAICMCSYTIYSWQYYQKDPQWNALSTTLLSIGIGVAPYSVKQIFK